MKKERIENHEPLFLFFSSKRHDSRFNRVQSSKAREKNAKLLGVRDKTRASHATHIHSTRKKKEALREQKQRRKTWKRGKRIERERRNKEDKDRKRRNERQKKKEKRQKTREWSSSKQQCLFHPSFTCTSLTTESTLSNLLARLFARFFISRPVAPSSNASLSLPYFPPTAIPSLFHPCFFYTGTQEGRKLLHATYLSFCPSVPYFTCFSLTDAPPFLDHLLLTRCFVFFPLFRLRRLFLLALPVSLAFPSRGHGRAEFEPGFDLAAPGLSRSA